MLFDVSCVAGNEAISKADVCYQRVGSYRVLYGTALNLAWRDRGCISVFVIALSKYPTVKSTGSESGNEFPYYILCMLKAFR